MADMDPLTMSGQPNGNGEMHKVPSSSSMGTGIQSDEEDLTFDNPKDEAAHYREKYRRIMDALDETRAELDEFQTSSKELEDELEKELAATERQQTELKDKIKRLEAEKEEWRAKHVALQKMHSSTVGNMQREMDNLRSERDKTLVALRDLEMGNDELERNERVAVSSLLDLESKYNRAIEEKTLLEQEVIQRQELEEECQRLKDDLRDANTEIGILRDQAARNVPTPPSSVSVPMSPVEETYRELSITDSSVSSDGQSQRQRRSKLPGAELSSIGANGLPRSPTTSFIPVSPARKRSTASTDSPLTMSRSATTQNLTSKQGITASPSLRRVRGGLPQPSPARVSVSANLAAKNKGFKLLHELQARLKATDDKLGTKVPKRNVSAPMPFGQTKRNISNLTTLTMPGNSKATHSRVSALQGPRKPDSTPMADADKSGATFLSPNGWVMVDDEETPTNQNHRNLADQGPISPLVSNFRSTSSASTSSRQLPSRPGIPSPLASSLSKSTNRPPSRSSNLAYYTRAPSRLGESLAGSSSGMTKSESGRFGSSRSATSSGISRSSSRQGMLNRDGHGHGGSDDSRPMSPTMIPRSSLRSPTPNFGSVLSSSTSASSSRPQSRQGLTGHASTTRALGRGPPPPSHTFPNAQPLTSSVSISTSTTAAGSGFKRPKRRSSVGAGGIGDIAPTGIPAPKASPGRPTSVPVFGANTPPPVPRIPSAHLRESARRAGLVGRERPQSEYN